MRHAYAVELDREKLEVLVSDLATVHESAANAIAEFERFLGAAAEAIDG